MGYQRSIVFTSRIDDATRRAVLDAAQQEWPTISLPPDRLAYPRRALFAAPELTDYLFDDDASYEAAHDATFVVSDGLTGFSTRFPVVTFAYISADCFGGTCLYSGFTAKAGDTIRRVDCDRKGCRKLLRDVGFWSWYYFAPFSRGFFDRLPTRITTACTRRSGG